MKAKTSTILSTEISKSMFQNIDTIYEFHEKNFYPELEKGLADGFVYLLWCLVANK